MRRLISCRARSILPLRALFDSPSHDLRSFFGSFLISRCSYCIAMPISNLTKLSHTCQTVRCSRDCVCSDAAHVGGWSLFWFPFEDNLKATNRNSTRAQANADESAGSPGAESKKLRRQAPCPARHTLNLVLTDHCSGKKMKVQQGAAATSAATSDSTTSASASASSSFDIIRSYHSHLSSSLSLPHPIAAINALCDLITHSTSSISTVSELISLIQAHSAHLKASLANPVPAQAGTDLFSRFVISMDWREEPGQGSGFEGNKERLVQVAREYCDKTVPACRRRICQRANVFIREGSVSRSCLKQGSRFLFR